SDWSADVCSSDLPASSGASLGRVRAELPERLFEREPVGEETAMTEIRFDMPLEEAMTTQRAVRRLKPDPVDDALVLRLIELAVKAPSGSNAQNWEFIVVRDPDVKAKLARRNRQAWHLYGGLGR